MVRKRRTKLPGSGDGCNAGSGSQDDGARQGGTPQPSGMPREDGAQRPPAVQLEGGAHNDPASQKLCHVAGTGWVPANPQPQGGRGRGSYHQPQGLPQGRGEPQQHQNSPGLSAPASYSGASSSRPSNVPMEQFQNLSIHTEPPIDKSRILASGEDMRPPARPEKKGILGTKCVVKANHFLATTQNKYLYQYDVSITPEVTSRVVNRAVMKKLVEMYKASHLGGRLPVYDGNKNLYTAGPLPFTSNEFHVALVDEDGGTGAERRQKNFRIVIKFAAGIDQNLLDMFLDGKLADIPQKVLQVLDIVLRERPATNYYSVGRSFYFRGDKADHSTQSLGGGLESRRGFYQSLRPTQMGLSLNIDMSSASFIEAVPVIDFVKQLLNKSTNVLSRPLTDSDRAKINKALRGVKVEVTHRANMRRKYRITALTSQATRELAFLVDERGLMKTVVQYFQETYRFTIQHTNWPCLQVGNQQRPNYLPMEVCKIVEGQRYSKRLNERQMTALLTTTCQLPQKRRLDIKNTVLENGYGSDSYAMEFGIKITEELTSVKARILNPPRLKYHDTGMEKECLPAMGQWNMMNKKMVNGGRVKKWICICFSEKADIRTVTKFCEKLVGICQTSGMEFESMPQYQHSRERPDQVERALKEHHQQNKNLDLLVAILPHNNGSLYGNLKRICETELGIISQCCLEKNIYNPTKQYLANVALKINVKVGGRNTVLLDAISRRMPLIERSPTIIFGADVTHPHPGEDSSPSIAAVVASQDWPEITKYVGLVCAQPHRKELIEKLYTYEFDPVIGHKHGGMIRELLQSFYQATRSKPKRIIFYRDGVSEGQFQLVMENELKAIMKACISLDESYQPPVTFVVVQKRHRTKLFPEENSKKQSTDRTGNIVPGTVVDSAICHPREFDFYLCSHAGIKGTSRPAHYHVLWDDNNFSADELQTFTNNLCYTYARCTKSVSIVPPAYYAHLAAFRARFYMEAELSESASIPNGPRITRANRDRPVRPLPALKDNVQSVMFFC